MVIFKTKRKLIEKRLTYGLKFVTFCLALNIPENYLARARLSKKSRVKVTDVCQSSNGTFSTLRHCVMPGRMLLGLNYEDGPYKDALKLMFNSTNFKVALKK